MNGLLAGGVRLAVDIGSPPHELFNVFTGRTPDFGFRCDVSVEVAVFNNGVLAPVLAPYSVVVAFKEFEPDGLLDPDPDPTSGAIATSFDIEGANANLTLDEWNNDVVGPDGRSWHSRCNFEAAQMADFPMDGMVGNRKSFYMIVYVNGPEYVGLAINAVEAGIVIAAVVTGADPSEGA